MGKKKKKRDKKQAVAAAEDVPSASFLTFRTTLREGPARYLPWLLLAWAPLVIWAYYKNLRDPFLNPAFWAAMCPPLWRMPGWLLMQHTSRLVTIGVFAAAATFLGRGLLRRLLRITDTNPLETAALGFGLGLGTIGLSTFLLGTLGLLHAWAVYALAAILSITAARLNRDLLTDPNPKLRWKDICDGPAAAALALFTTGALGFMAFHALAPVIAFDSLVYHLGLPTLYRLEGGLTATPTNLYSGIPMLLQWVYTFLLFFADEGLCQLLQWTCGLGIAALLVGLGSRCRRPLLGWTACVVLLPIPLVIYNIIRAAVDIGVTYMVLLTVYSLALLLDTDDEQRRSRLSVLAGVLCGLAMSLKYTVWPLLPVSLIVLWRLKVPATVLKKYALITGAVILPWILKNLWLYGNPIFPYFHDTLVPGSEFPSPWRVLHADAWGRDWNVIVSSGRQLWETLLHPWFLTVKGSTEFDHLGPIFLIALPALAWTRPANTVSRAWMWILFGLWLLWWPLTGMPRFFLPGLCLLSVFVAAVILQTRSIWVRNSLLVLLVALAIDSLAIFSLITSKTDSMSYLIGGMPKQEYLRHTRRTFPACYIPAADWLGDHTEDSARVLLLGAGRGHYLPRRFITSTQLDVDVLGYWLTQSSSPEELWRRFSDKGITHVLVNMAWIWRTDPEPGVTPEHHRVLGEFFRRYARLRFNDVDQHDPRWVQIYELGEGLPGQTEQTPALLSWYRKGGRSGMPKDGIITAAQGLPGS